MSGNDGGINVCCNVRANCRGVLLRGFGTFLRREQLDLVVSSLGRVEDGGANDERLAVGTAFHDRVHEDG